MILGEGERERERKRKRGKTGNKKEKRERERESPEKTAGQLVGLVVCAGWSCEQSPRTEPFNSPQLQDGVCLQEHTVHKQKSRCFSFFCFPFLLESFSLLALPSVPSVRSLCSVSADSALLLTEASDDGGWPEELLCRDRVATGIQMWSTDTTLGSCLGRTGLVAAVEETEPPDLSQKKKAFASPPLMPNHQLRTAPAATAAAGATASSHARIDLRTAEESCRAYLIGAAFCIWSRIIYELLLVALV